MRARFREVMLSCLLALGLSATYGVQHLKAQVLYGSVLGTVTDQTGGVVPNATVIITNVETGQAREGTTDDAGYYSILDILEGRYDLTVKATGFRPYTEKNVRVSINTVTRVNVSLQLGQVTESVTVEASAAVLQTTKVDVSVNLESRAMENLPLSNYRNYQTLINLVPGATPARFRTPSPIRPGAPCQPTSTASSAAPTTPAWTVQPISWSRCLTTRCTSRRWKALRRSTSPPTTSMPSRG